MQPIEKKHRKTIPHLRLWLTIACAAALLLVSAAVFMLERTEPYVPSGDVSGTTELITKTHDEVTSVTVTLRGGETWTLLRGEDGVMRMKDDPDFLLDEIMLRNVLDAACVVSYEEDLTRDPAQYQDRLS